MCTPAKQRQRGVTLVELIVFIIIVSVALAGVLSSLNLSVAHSADPLQPKQALSIAEGLLEEILLKSFCDPDAAGTVMTDYPPTCGTNTIETSRADYDSVDDFDTTIDNATETEITTDLLGTAWPSGYHAYVKITTEGTATIGTTGHPARIVTVRVSYNSDSSSISLTGYRANF